MANKVTTEIDIRHGGRGAQAQRAINVTVWGENVHEKKHKAVAAIYPRGMHTAIADALNQDHGIRASTATLDQPEHGLTEQVLSSTDVLTWWGHAAHGEVKD